MCILSYDVSIPTHRAPAVRVAPRSAKGHFPRFCSSLTSKAPRGQFRPRVLADLPCLAKVCLLGVGRAATACRCHHGRPRCRPSRASSRRTPPPWPRRREPRCPRRHVFSPSRPNAERAVGSARCLDTALPARGRQSNLDVAASAAIIDPPRFGRAQVCQRKWRHCPPKFFGAPSRPSS